MDSPRVRPRGVIVLAGVYGFTGAGTIALGILLRTGLAGAILDLDKLAAVVGAQNVPQALGFLSILWLVTGAAYVVNALGLFYGRRWAFFLTIGLVAPNVLIIPNSIPGVVFAVVAVWYVTRPWIREWLHVGRRIAVPESLRQQDSAER